MSEHNDCWQFRVFLAGTLIAVLGIAVWLLGIHIESQNLSAVGVRVIYVGDAVGFCGMAAGTLTLGWKHLQGRR